MNKMLAAATTIVAAMGAFSAAHAEVSTSLSYSQLSFDSSSIIHSDLNAVTVRGGWKQNNGPVGVELEGSFGVGDDDSTLSGAPSTVKLKQQVAGYAVLNMPGGDNFGLFARIGYGSTKIENTSATDTATNSDESVNFGFGATYTLDGANGVRFDFTKINFNDGGGATLVGLGYLRKF